MAGGLSDRAIARLAALEGGAEATAFVAGLVARGRSSYTLRSYAAGLEHFLAWTTARGVGLVDVRRATVDEYVAEFARGERGGVAAGRAPATVNHRVSVLAGLFGYLIEPRRAGQERDVGGARESGAGGRLRYGRRARH